MGDLVQAEFGDSYGNMSLVYSQETTPLGTGGALRLAAPLIQSDMVLVMNGDSFCDVDMEGLKAWHYEHNADGSMVLVRVPDAREFGCEQRKMAMRCIVILILILIAATEVSGGADAQRC